MEVPVEINNCQVKYTLKVQDYEEILSLLVDILHHKNVLRKVLSILYSKQGTTQYIFMNCNMITHLADIA